MADYGKCGVLIFRKRSNLTQSDVACKLGITRATYSLKERNGGFTAEEIRKLIGLFGMTLKDVGDVFFHGAFD